MQSWFAIISLTLISGIGDAAGFVYASRIWQAGQFHAEALMKSALGFIVGIGTYWLVVKFLSARDILSPELQTLFWFGATMTGIAIISGKVFHWPIREQLVGVIVLSGIAWLLYHVE